MSVRGSYFDKVRREIESYRKAVKELELYRSGKSLDLVKRYYDSLKSLKV